MESGPCKHRCFLKTQAVSLYTGAAVFAKWAGANESPGTMGVGATQFCLRDVAKESASMTTVQLESVTRPGLEITCSMYHPGID